MSENPDVIRADIEATRARLGSNVDAVADKVTPSHIVQRQTDKVKDAVFGAKEKVMGANDHVTGMTASATGTAGARIDDAGAALSEAPHRIATKTEGNPLAAGLIAFGAGLLVASLFPPSQKEREAADSLKSAAEPMTEELSEAAKNLALGLKEPAQEAMENVKASAIDATEQVKAEGEDAVADVKETSSSATDKVREA